MSSNSRARGILLRAVNYRDNDRVLTLLTDDFGKIGVIARGARKSKNRFSGSLEPFSILDLELSFGRTDLAALKSANIRECWPALYQNLSKIGMLGTAMGYVRDWLPDHAREQKIFEMVRSFFGVIATSPAQRLDLFLIIFQTKLLVLTGYSPHLSSCVSCRRVPRPHQSAYFDPVSDGIRCTNCGGGALLISSQSRNFLLDITQKLPEDWCFAQHLSDLERQQAVSILHCMVQKFNHKSEPPRFLSAWDIMKA